MEEGQEIQGAAGSDEKQLVIFGVAKEEFGIDIDHVLEIIRLESITRIPNAPEFVKGVINLRGGIIVIVDLATKLGIPKKENDDDTRIIVVKSGKDMVGVIVDCAKEVLRVNDKFIKPPPGVVTKKISSDYLNGVAVLDERLIILLNMEKVFADQTQLKSAEVAMKGSKEESKKETKQDNKQDDSQVKVKAEQKAA